MSERIFAYRDEESDYVDPIEKHFSRFIDVLHASDLKVNIKAFECILQKQMQAPSMHLSAGNPTHLQTPPLKLPTIQTPPLNATVLLTGMQLSSVQDEVDIFGNFVYKTLIEHSINNLRQEILEPEVQTENAQGHLQDLKNKFCGKFSPGFGKQCSICH